MYICTWAQGQLLEHGQHCMPQAVAILLTLSCACVVLVTMRLPVNEYKTLVMSRRQQFTEFSLPLVLTLFSFPVLQSYWAIDRKRFIRMSHLKLENPQQFY